VTGTASLTPTSTATPSATGTRIYDVLLATGSNTVCYLITGGIQNIYCLGDNSDYQFQSTTPSEPPYSYTPIALQGNVHNNYLYSTLAGNYDTFCAFNTGDVGLECWGMIYDSTSTFTATSTPTSPATSCGSYFSTATGAVAIGSQHICAVVVGTGACPLDYATYLNAVVCWGDDSYYQLGIGETRSITYDIGGVSTSPTPSANSPQFPVVTCADYSTCETSPDVSVVLNVDYLVAGTYHTCAASNAGATYNIYCWGDNTYGQIGGTSSTFPTGYQYDVAVLAYSTQSLNIGLAAGNFHTCVLDINFDSTSSTLYCWGNNNNNQLGGSTTTYTQTPQNLNSYFPPVAPSVTPSYPLVALGQFGPSDTTCAIDSNNQAWCIGQDVLNQLDDLNGHPIGSGDSYLNANLITTAGQDYSYTPSTANALPVIRMSAGQYFMCAVTIQRQLYCWGMDDDGQVGIYPSSLTPDINNDVHTTDGPNLIDPLF
jgi:hypothetical protein